MNNASYLGVTIFLATAPPELTTVFNEVWGRDQALTNL